MKAIIKQVQGCSFLAKADSNHWTVIDNTKEHSGQEAATHPMELVLLALGSCSGCDVASILAKKKVQLQGFEIHITADRADTYPKVFTNIHLEYFFTGKDLNTTHLERAIELSQEKYCPVSAMIKKAVPITTSYRVLKPAEQ